MDLVDEIYKKIKELRATNKKPRFIILDENSFKEIRTKRDEFFPSYHTRECDGNEFMGIKVSVVLNTRDDTRVVEVV